MRNIVRDLCEKLYREKNLTFEEFEYLYTLKEYAPLTEFARKVTQEHFGNKVYVRGLIEITTFCKNNCYYCGLRKGNTKVERVRLHKDEILLRGRKAYNLGIRTLVLQGGEDGFYDIDYLVTLVEEMRRQFTDMAITLSIGEKDFIEYEKLKKAGVNRFLLRHETADKGHYEKLHPQEMRFENRTRCLENLKRLGYQTGCGMMIGSPYQKNEDVYRDLLFILRFKPHMVGIGPFIPHKDTPFRDFPAGKVEDVLKMIALVRLADQRLLLPATTALGTIDKKGREKGILAGANVLMPNVGEEKVRKNYSLYNNKLGTELENEDDFMGLSAKVRSIGYELSLERGDY